MVDSSDPLFALLMDRLARIDASQSTISDRLGRAEIHIEALTAQLKTIESKQDVLVETAAMGKGAWWIMLRLGGLLTLIASLGAALYNVGAALFRGAPR